MSEHPPTIVTFVVRVHRAGDQPLRGVVERVATHEKEAFQEPADIGRIIARLVEAEPARAPLPADDSRGG